MDFTEFLLKIDQCDQILRVRNEEFDQISNMIRCQGWEICSKLTEQDLCWNWTWQVKYRAQTRRELRETCYHPFSPCFLLFPDLVSLYQISRFFLPCQKFSNSCSNPHSPSLLFISLPCLALPSLVHTHTFNGHEVRWFFKISPLLCIVISTALI